MATAVQKKKKAGRAAVAIKLPTKRKINLATVGETSIQWGVAIPSILLIIVLAALLAKFAIVDRYAALSRAEGHAAELRQQVSAAQQKVTSYGELVDLYAHYTYSGMTEEELALVDRVAVMELLQRVVKPRAEMGSWGLDGNRLTVSVTGATLEEINQIMKELRQEPSVAYCTVSTASTNSLTYDDQQETSAHTDVTAYLTIDLQNVEEEASEP